MRFTTVVSLALLTAGAVAQNNVFGGNQNNDNNNNNQNNNNDNQNNNNNNNQNNQNNDQNNNNNNDQNNNNNNQAGDAALQLDPNNVQAGSNADGQAEGAEEGQAASLTDPANFINFCTGKTLTNGIQEEGGSCNGIPMGDIPSTGNMVSSIIVNPKPGVVVQEGQDISFEVQVQGLNAGSFTNPDNTYYSAPQQLQGGQIVGHTHVTVQDIGNSLDPQNPPDPQTFAFFKGINDAGNGNGLLSAVAAGGLPAGFYRVCTMTSASNHQPVLMPVAQRGAQDDCTKFEVGQAVVGGDDNANQDQQNQDQQNQNNQNQDNANQDQQNQDQQNQDQQNQDQQNQDQQNANQDQQNANQDQQNQNNANQDQQNQNNANQDQQNQNNANQDQQNQNQNNQNNQNGNNQFGGFGNGGFGGFGNRFGRNRFGRNRRFAAREFVA